MLLQATIFSVVITLVYNQEKKISQEKMVLSIQNGDEDAANLLFCKLLRIGPF